ncbi:hypothetical protein LTR08_007858 [Meristemomyces frigidus]|nr:hypothetical protein LTR08_007858 [Meristemomyces frigidus]
MRLGDILAAKPGDPRPQYDDVMAQPTVGELYEHLNAVLDRQTGGARSRCSGLSGRHRSVVDGFHFALDRRGVVASLTVGGWG